MSSLNASLAVFLPLTLNGSSISAHNDRSWLGLVCALALAIQHVHSRDGVIVGELANLKTNFNLSYEVLGTRGNAALAVDKAFDFLYESRQLADSIPCRRQPPPQDAHLRCRHRATLSGQARRCGGLDRFGRRRSQRLAVP